MKIVCISDTHTYGKKVKVPDGDVLIHAGDHTFQGTEPEIRAALKWLASHPHEHKLFVAGNHDFFLDPSIPDGHQFRYWSISRTRTIAEVLAEFPSLTYLCDSSVVIDGVKFYGSPWTPWFWGWAFNFPLLYPMRFSQHTVNAGQRDEEAAAKKWAEIPADVNVLITHGPPRGILDEVEDPYNDAREGCPALRKRVEQLENLRLHVFGHLHESYGRADFESEDGSTLTFVNAAINTRAYTPTNPPIVVDL